MKKKNIAFNAVFHVLYQLLNVLFPLITSIYVSRIILPEGIGRVSYAQNIASYFITLAPLGVASYGVRVIAQSHNNIKNLENKFSELFCINFLSTLFFSVIYYIIIIFIFNYDIELYYICGLQIILNFFNVDWFYQGLEEYKYITIRSFIIKVISLIAVFVFVQNTNDYLKYAFISVCAVAGNYIFNIIYLRRYVRLNLKKLNLKQHLVPEFILALNILLINLYSKTDITMLGSMKNNTITGYYSNAFKIVNIVIMMSIAITDVFLPRLSYYYNFDKKRYTQLLNKGIQIIIFIVFPTVVGLDIIAPELIPLLFGQAFKPASETVIILSPLIVIKGIGNLVCYQVLISTGNEKKQTFPYLISALLNVFLNFMLIPSMSQNGAAIASVLSELILNTIIFSYSLKIVKMNMNFRNIFKTIISTIVMLIVISICLKVFSASIFYYMLTIAIGGFTYVVCNVILKNIVLTEFFNTIKLNTRKGN